VTSASDLDLEIDGAAFRLEAEGDEARYGLQLKLACELDDERAEVRFDKATGVLRVQCPVAV